MNRSAWVAAQALVLLGLNGEQAVQTIQRQRPGTLYNFMFAENVRHMG
jgi:hypothetical protein